MKKIIMALLITSFSISGAQAEDDSTEEEAREKAALIDRVIAAYGGTALTEMTSYRITSETFNQTLGQSHDPALDEINLNKSVLLVDIENNRVSFDNLNHNRGGLGQGRTVVNGEEATNLNVQNMTTTPAAAADVYQLFGGLMRTTDTLLARELGISRADAKIAGKGMYQNRAQTLVTLPFPSSPELTLFIDNESALISKMQRTTAFGDLDYVFNDIKQSDGVTYASRMTFFIAGKMNVTGKQELQFNFSTDDAEFGLPDSAVEAGEQFNASEMVVNKLSEKVYHVGQNGGFSIFIDTPQGIVSAGGYPGITARLEAFSTASGSNKLLTHQIVTHHHSDHVGGLGEAAGMGAKLVTVATNVEAIKEFVPVDLADQNFLLMTRPTTFSEGRDRVEVYEVSTSHAASFLVTYVPSVKAVFIADHFGSPFVSGVPTANINSVTMHAALKKLGIDVKKITTAHNGRIFTWKELEQSVAGFKIQDCQLDRPVCSM